LQAEFNLEEHEKQLILTALKKANHNVSEAARLLGLTRAALDNYSLLWFMLDLWENGI
jgi:transcriptional regulator with GAF, ATPase, and Fis domain